MPEIDLDDLYAKAKAATPGPWKWSGVINGDRDEHGQVPSTRLLQPPPHYGTILDATEHKINRRWAGLVSEQNADYIAAANPAVVMELIERVRKAEGQLISAQGYDRIGDGKSGAWACKCKWSSKLHGNECPEHGTIGIEE